MSSDTFTTAMFLITAVLAAGVLINAVFPVVFQMSQTFSSATHSSDVRIRTDFSVITTFGNTQSQFGQIWLKNIGSQPVSLNEIQASDVFFGATGNFHRLTWSGSPVSPPPPGEWSYEVSNVNGNNNYWDPGETIEIDVVSPAGSPFASTDTLYFQLVLPNGVFRSIQYAPFTPPGG